MPVIRIAEFKPEYSRSKLCQQCGHSFERPKLSRAQWATIKHCSKRCAWKSRPRKRKLTAYCHQCGVPFEPYAKSMQYCSNKCSGLSRQINDGLTKSQRHARKNGITKFGSPEYRSLISNRTKKAMAAGEVRTKLSRPRQAQSPEVRQKHSDALAGIMPKNNKGRWKHVHRGMFNIDGTLTFFRSRWEANYALYLNFLLKRGAILSWEYEPDRFLFEKIQIGTRSYCPDFKIRFPDGCIEYHELKGWMDPKSKTKLNRMAKFFPNIKIVLVDADSYRRLSKLLGRICGFFK